MTVQVRCIKPFGTSVPGDLAEVPDGAAFSPEYWEPATEAAPAAAAHVAHPQSDAALRFPPHFPPAPPKEM
jgi:hypothetical protein